MKFDRSGWGNPLSRAFRRFREFLSAAPPQSVFAEDFSALFVHAPRRKRFRRRLHSRRSIEFGARFFFGAPLQPAQNSNNWLAPAGIWQAVGARF